MNNSRAFFPLAIYSSKSFPYGVANSKQAMPIIALKKKNKKIIYLCNFSFVCLLFAWPPAFFYFAIKKKILLNEIVPLSFLCCFFLPHPRLIHTLGHRSWEEVPFYLFIFFFGNCQNFQIMEKFNNTKN